jgi:hypothetical protein
MSDKRAVLDRIVALIEEHGLTLDEIAARLGARRSTGSPKGLVAQLLAYLGGIFVFSGVGLLMSFIWDDAGSAQRVVLSFGAGLAAFVLGIVCVHDVRFAKATTPLFLISAFLQPFGLFVFLDEYLPPPEDPQLAALGIFGVLAVQHAVVFYALRRSVLLFVAVAFGAAAIGAAMDLLGVDGEVIGVVIGAALLGLAWVLGRTSHRVIAPFWFFVSGALLLGAWWSLTEGTAFDLSNLGLQALLIALSIRATSRSLLVASVIGLFAYLSYFAYEHFADVVGWPLTMIALGLAMIGISGWAVRLGRRMGPA